MDSETLFSLVLIVIYFLFQAFSGKKKQKGKPRPVPQERPEAPRSTGSQPQTLEEALREIREALGAPRPEPAEQKPSSPEPAAERPHPLIESRPASLPPAPPKRWEMPRRQEFQPVAKEHREAHFLKDIEEAGPYRPVADVETDRGLDEQPAPLSKRQRTLRRRLKEPKATRDAVLLAEILGPPRAKRRR